MTILTTTATWSDPVTLAQDEIFQCHEGEVYLTLEADAPDLITDGLRLGRWDSFIAPSGSTVRWAATSPGLSKLYRGAAQ